MVVIGDSAIKTVVAGNTATAQVVAANSARTHLTIQNVSDTDVYLAEGTAAVSGQGFLLLAAGANIYVTGENGVIYMGAVNSITSAGSKALSVKEN